MSRKDRSSHRSRNKTKSILPSSTTNRGWVFLQSHSDLISSQKHLEGSPGKWGALRIRVCLGPLLLFTPCAQCGHGRDPKQDPKRDPGTWGRNCDGNTNPSSSDEPLEPPPLPVTLQPQISPAPPSHRRSPFRITTARPRGLFPTILWVIYTLKGINKLCKRSR